MKAQEHVKHGFEYAGVIPMFFMDAVAKDSESIQTVADTMDAIYQFGGFRYPFGGTVDSEGLYQSGGDEPLSPLVTCKDSGYTLHVYPYSITALVDSEGNQKIGRFD